MQPDFKAGIRTVLNCRGSPWKVLEFSSTLNVVAWKFFWICFGCRWQNINHSSEFLMVTYIKGFLLYAIAKLTNVEKVVKQTVQAFKGLRMEWECVYFCTVCETAFLVVDPWNRIWSSKSPSKWFQFFFMNPVKKNSHLLKVLLLKLLNPVFERHVL